MFRCAEYWNDLGSSTPFLSQPLISSAITAAFSKLNPSSSTAIFAAVGVPANRSSAIAPTISCPSGPYACAAVVDERMAEIARSRLRRAEDFIFGPQGNRIEFRLTWKSPGTIFALSRQHSHEFFRDVSEVSGNAIQASKFGRSPCSAGIVHSRS